MMSSGRADTCSVVGWYCSTSPIGSRATTAPGLSARLRPTSNASGSTILGIPPLFRRSSTKCPSPRTRLRPPVSNARLSAAGFVGEVVRRGERADEDVRREPGLLGAAGVVRPLGVVLDHLGERARGGQVAALDPVEERVARPRRIAEAPVPLGGGDLRAADGDAHELAAQPHRLAGHRLPMGERRGQAAERLPDRRDPEHLAALWLHGGLSVLGPGCFRAHGHSFRRASLPMSAEPGLSSRPIRTGAQVCGSSVRWTLDPVAQQPPGMCGISCYCLIYRPRSYGDAHRRVAVRSSRGERRWRANPRTG